MKNSILLTLLLISCATVGNRIESRAECEAQCGSYGYGIQAYTTQGCLCDGNCVRPKHKGGCEGLPEATGETVKM